MKDTSVFLIKKRHRVPVTDRLVETYHTVVSKDLDIIHRTAQVLRYLPSDTSYCLIAVRLQDTHTQDYFFWRCNYTTKVNYRALGNMAGANSSNTTLEILILKINICMLCSAQ